MRTSDVDILIAGSAGLAFDDVRLPDNVKLLGIVPDGLRDSLLRFADVALNPMTSGSGSNIKMLDYLSAGVPVITTEIGARGLGLSSDHVSFAETTQFARIIDSVLDATDEAGEARTRAGRSLVEERYDWEVIGAGLRELVLGRGAVTPAQSASAPSDTSSPLSRSR